MRNPFRHRDRRSQFEQMLRNYQERARILFYPDGRRCRGNSWATNFWRGFDNVQPGAWDRASKESMSYVVWCAGRAAATTEKEG